ncbi:MAG: hypothetical protein KIS76_19530 [Pyrinomonadaceae bacterium]|nr:hypothetical protein [Pyrinomonadaceae bacterium]
MLYVLICLCLALAGVAGLQFFYMIYLERIERERKKRISLLERRNKVLQARLEDAEAEIEDKRTRLQAIYNDNILECDEIWVDVIEDR